MGAFSPLCAISPDNPRSPRVSGVLLGDAPIDGDVVEDQPDDAVVGLAGDAGQRAEHPNPIHSSRRVRSVVAEQVLSSMSS
jgi:hypothetical protein